MKTISMSGSATLAERFNRCAAHKMSALLPEAGHKRGVNAVSDVNLADLRDERFLRARLAKPPDRRLQGPRRIVVALPRAALGDEPRNGADREGLGVEAGADLVPG